MEPIATLPKRMSRLGKEALWTSVVSPWAEQNFAAYDLVNLHFLMPGTLRLLPLVPRTAKLVLSFWGDDLFNLRPEELSLQTRALERADLITMHSAEMRQIFRAKFGTRYDSRIRVVLFGVSAQIVHEIESRDAATERAAFRTEYGIAADQVVVAVGYCGSPRQNHQRVLGALQTLPAETKRRVVVVLAMTYGAPSATYADDIRRAAEAAGVRPIVLTTRLPASELARLRLSTDVMIHLPESDAMSSSFVEALWSGTIVIAGTWLPYGQLRAAGIAMSEISTIAQLPQTMTAVLDDLAAYRASAKVNRARAAFLLSTEQAKAWEDIYREALMLEARP
jgi:glycosyltransferase involved in cell wall biosynthesis